MGRKFFVDGNWKCNGTFDEVKKIVNILNEGQVPSQDVVEVVVSPPYVFLPVVKSSLKPEFHVAAQNCWVKNGGAFTGEVSAEMLVNLEVPWVILGHSERRLILGESNEFVADKVAYALSQGLKVIACVGETLEQREAGTTVEVVAAQTKANFHFSVALKLLIADCRSIKLVSSTRPIAGVKSSVSNIVCYSLKADSRSNVLEKFCLLLLCATPLRPIAGVQFLFPFIEGRLPKRVVVLDFCDCIGSSQEFVWFEEPPDLIKDILVYEVNNRPPPLLESTAPSPNSSNPIIPPMGASLFTRLRSIIRTLCDIHHKKKSQKRSGPAVSAAPTPSPTIQISRSTRCVQRRERKEGREGVVGHEAFWELTGFGFHRNSEIKREGGQSTPRMGDPLGSCS
ncbi:hypothetical protein ACFX13_017657 [Malus domestica]